MSDEEPKTDPGPPSDPPPASVPGPSDSGPNKRLHRRFQVRVPLYISIEGEIFRKKVRLESKDLSAGGLSFETGREVPIEAETRVVVARIGDLEEPALIQGRVARVVQDPETGRYIVGIEFTGFENISPEDLVKRIEGWR